MRHMLAVPLAALIVSVALTAPPARTASADGPAPSPSPAPSPAPPKAPDCAACIQCVAACGTAYADCTRKCLSLPDIAAQQGCVAQCPPVTQCAQACPCAGCTPAIPGLPH